MPITASYNIGLNYYGIELNVSIKGSQNAVAQTKQNFSYHGNSPDVSSQDIWFPKFMAGWADTHAGLPSLGSDVGASCPHSKQ